VGLVGLEANDNMPCLTHTWKRMEQLGMTLGGLRSSLYTFLHEKNGTRSMMQHMCEEM
jgi:hypothetical protein